MGCVQSDNTFAEKYEELQRKHEVEFRQAVEDRNWTICHGLLEAHTVRVDRMYEQDCRFADTRRARFELLLVFQKLVGSDPLYDPQLIAMFTSHVYPFQAKDSIMHQVVAKFSDPVPLLTRMLDQGTDINLPGRHNWSVLHMATYAQQFETVLFLLRRGACVNTRDDRGYAPLHYAVMKKNLDIVRVLLSFGADTSDGYLLDRISKPEIATTMLEYGADPFIIDARSQASSFMFACCYQEPQMVRALAAGATLDQLDQITPAGYTALMFAATSSQPEVVEFLLQHGVNPAKRNIMGQTALDFAKNHNFVACVELLNQALKERREQAVSKFKNQRQLLGPEAF